MTRYDAIVVGARVAGSATARCLARRGYRVLLVDKAHFPSDTISSHLVKARAIAYLDRWGLRPALVAQETDFRTAFSFTCEGLAVRGHATGQALRRTLAREHGWEELNDIPDGPIEWACVRRTVLDAVLVDAAAAAGVEIRQGFPVTELLRAKEAELLAELRKTIKVEIDRDALARAKVESFDAGAAGDARAPIDAGR